MNIVASQAMNWSDRRAESWPQVWCLISVPFYLCALMGLVMQA